MRLHFFNSAVIANSKMDYYCILGRSKGSRYYIQGVECLYFNAQWYTTLLTVRVSKISQVC